MNHSANASSQCNELTLLIFHTIINVCTVRRSHNVCWILSASPYSMDHYSGTSNATNFSFCDSLAIVIWSPRTSFHQSSEGPSFWEINMLTNPFPHGQCEAHFCPKNGPLNETRIWHKFRVLSMPKFGQMQLDQNFKTKAIYCLLVTCYIRDEFPVRKFMKSWNVVDVRHWKVWINKIGK